MHGKLPTTKQDKLSLPKIEIKGIYIARHFLFYFTVIHVKHYKLGITPTFIFLIQPQYKC